MNDDSEKCRSRRPPGGECSNIFGEPNPVLKTSSKLNPSFESSVFSIDDSLGKQTVPKQRIRISKISNIPMFSTFEERQNSFCCNRLRGKTMQSSVFDNIEYPENIKFEPGVSRSSFSAYKKSNKNTKSTIFDELYFEERLQKKCLESPSLKSTVFDSTPPTTSKPGIKTHISAINCKKQEQKFLSYKRPSKFYNRSRMVAGTCDVESDTDNNSLVLISSGTKVSPFTFRKSNHVCGKESQNEQTNNSDKDMLWSNTSKPCFRSVKRKNHQGFYLSDPNQCDPLWFSDFRLTSLHPDKRYDNNIRSSSFASAFSN